MIKLRLDNRWVYITGAPRSVIRELESITSYRVAGFMFAPSFKRGHWDGKEHLLRFSSKRGYHAPRGLVTDIARALRAEGHRYTVEHVHAPLPERRKLVWESSVVMRGYQDEAINALLAPPVRGSGVLKMPIRSGKTKMAARLIRRIGQATLFVVPSKSLLYQTREALAECFPLETIGLIGDSEHDEQFITVASIQTLAMWREGGRWKMMRPAKKQESRVAWLEEHGWEPSGELWRKGRIKPVAIVKAIEREASDREAERKATVKAKYKGLLKAFPLLILDECFIAGTLVDGRPIESIAVGDMVAAFDNNGTTSQRRVTRTFKTVPSSLVRIRFNDGRTLTCTPGHPFFTACGWVKACELRPGSDMVLSTNAKVHDLRTGIGLGERSCSSFGTMEENRKNLLQDSLRPCIHREGDPKLTPPTLPGGAGGFIEANEGEQPDALGACACQNGSFAACSWPFSQLDQGRERTATTNCTSGPCSCFGMGDRMRCEDGESVTWSGSNGRDFVLLQAGCCQLDAEARNRARRPLAPHSESTCVGQKENRLSEWDGVDGVEVLQPGSDKRFGGLCPDGFVYNLEVEGLHTYIANGLAVHNCHHYRGTGEWYKVPHEFDSRFKVGLSATAYLDNSVEQERGIIWLKATCGPIRCDIPMSRLIADGFLMKQHVRMFRVTTPNLNGRKWSATMRRQAIVTNRRRNAIIVMCAAKYAAEGRRIAIIARLHEHIGILCEAMDEAGLEYRTITGHDDQEAREDIVDGLVRGDYHVIIGTVIGEGVDIPQMEVVINAEGGRDTKSTVQRQRNLTINKGKRQAVLVDFLDETNDHLRKHSEARLEVYRSEPMFQIDLVG